MRSSDICVVTHRVSFLYFLFSELVNVLDCFEGAQIREGMTSSDVRNYKDSLCYLVKEWMTLYRNEYTPSLFTELRNSIGTLYTVNNITNFYLNKVQQL